MKPEKIFFLTLVVGAFVALLMFLAAVFELSAYQDLVALAFPQGAAKLGQAGFFHAGMAGGLFIGWNLTLLLLAKNHALAKERALWSAILWGVVAWYLLDSVASVTTGAVYNVIGNTLYFTLLLWPVLMMRRNAA